MKITANEIKPGMIIEHKNDYWNVLKTQHVKPGKGGAFNQVELKSVIKGTKLNERFRSSETVEKAAVEEEKFTFLYEDENDYFFMNPKSFDQINIKINIDQVKFSNNQILNIINHIKNKVEIKNNDLILSEDNNEYYDNLLIEDNNINKDKKYNN